ncbi:SET domain-containing protein 9-like [Watersipora subatra]|uniref:SET domain-containing protein 9-like n=1 Tax=Watersipora subatra TaxID=2589382 RepID=UPI00355C05B4
MRWKSYRHRFLPWILLNWRKQFLKNSPKNPIPSHGFVDSSYFVKQLDFYLTHLNGALQSRYGTDETIFLTDHLSRSFARCTKGYCTLGLQSAEETLGFTISRCRSTIIEAGTGVRVTKGVIPKNHLVALYPGLIYQVGEPILLQSLANKFIFRCQDGVLLDGNDRALSKHLFRSCAGRDIVGAHLMCDISWLTDHPINMLNVGQYINNHTEEMPANVEYHELDLELEFPARYLKYIPNIEYSWNHQENIPRTRRIILLRSLREINTGEELFSTYFRLIK